MTSWTKVITWKPSSQYTFILRGPRVAIFANAIKVVTMFIKKLKKSLKNYKFCTEIESISVILDKAKSADFWWNNSDVSRTEGVFHMIHIFIFFGFALGNVYNCAKFHHFRICMICVTHFRERALLLATPSVNRPKKVHPENG